MTHHQGSPGAESPVVALQPLAFLQTHDDGHKAVFRAQVGNMGEPDAAVFALTVTLASPAGDEQAKREIENFLGKMRAGFALIAREPGDDQPGDTNPEPFNIDTDILIEPELVQAPAGKGPVGVTAAVQATVEGLTLEGVLIELITGVLRGLAWLVFRRFQTLYPPYPYYTIGKGGCNKFTVRRGGRLGATVTSCGGEATVRPPEPPNPGHWIGTGNTTPRMTARTISVIGLTPCTYVFCGDYNPDF